MLPRWGCSVVALLWCCAVTDELLCLRGCAVCDGVLMCCAARAAVLLFCFLLCYVAVLFVLLFCCRVWIVLLFRRRAVCGMMFAAMAGVLLRCVDV